MQTSWISSHWFAYTKALCTICITVHVDFIGQSEKLENEIKVYNSENDQLKELNRKIFEFFMSGSMVCILGRNCLSMTTSVYYT